MAKIVDIFLINNSLAIGDNLFIKVQDDDEIKYFISGVEGFVEITKHSNLHLEDVIKSDGIISLVNNVEECLPIYTINPLDPLPNGGTGLKHVAKIGNKILGFKMAKSRVRGAYCLDVNEKKCRLFESPFVIDSTFLAQAITKDLACDHLELYIHSDPEIKIKTKNQNKIENE